MLKVIHIRAVVVLSILAILCAGLAPTAMAAGPTGPADPRELEAFFDGYLAAQMEARHLPGATVAVVKDGALFFAKGYGYADVAQQTPVDPERTLFHAGSVSKLFTWTAVMQLVEAGRLDLDADVNTYLKDLQIPATYPQPITLAHLMSHTPGFEDEGLGVFVAQPGDLAPLGQYLATHMPARVRPPGEISAYSNYGTALAGHIVAQVSGEPFEQYVSEHILKPLGMEHSSFQQPLPPALAGGLATGYRYVGGAPQAGAAEWCQPSPAGALSTTAADMAAFMIAHLQDGRYGGARILREATAQRMHGRLFGHDPRASGFAHGFMELNLNGQRMLSHGGDTLLFHSLLVLLPERHVGLFVSFNSMGEGAGAVEGRYELLQAFLDRYYPAPKPAAPQPPADFSARAGRFAGQYLAARSNATTVEKLLGLLQQISVGATSEGVLLVSGAAPEPSRWVEVEPLVFRNVANQDRLYFRADARGNVTHMFEENNPTTAYIRLPWWAGASFQLPFVGLTTLLLVSALPWPLGLLRRKHTPGEPRRRLPHLARGLAWAMSALDVAFLAGLASVLSPLQQAPFGMPAAVRALFVLPLLGAGLAVAVAACALLAWVRRPSCGLAGRVHYTLVAAAGLAFVWWLSCWNLLGFRF